MDISKFYGDLDLTLKNTISINAISIDRDITELVYALKSMQNKLDNAFIGDEMNIDDMCYIREVSEQIEVYFFLIKEHVKSLYQLQKKVYHIDRKRIETDVDTIAELDA